MEGQQMPMGQDLLNPNMGMSGPEVYTTQPDSGHMRHASLGDMGQADQFAPPTINIEPAPVSRQASFGPQGEQIEGALSPPSGSSSKPHLLLRDSVLTCARRPQPKQVRPDWPRPTYIALR